jgi:hypothetical protein
MSLAGFVSDRVPLSIVFLVIGFLTLISALVGFNLKGLKNF